MTPTEAESTLLELKQNRIEQIRLLETKTALARLDGLRFYHPHNKQDLFHRSTARRRLVCAGNRFGKSQMGCAEDIAWLRGERPWLASVDVGRISGIPQRPVKGLVITTDWDKVSEIWSDPNSGKLWRMLRKDDVVSTSRNHSGAIDHIVVRSPFGGVSSLSFDTVKSFMTNPLGTESSDWDFIHVDEPCPQAMFTAAARGLVDRGGSSWFSLTPLREPWISDMFAPENAGPNNWALTGSIYDNPYLTKEAIAEFESLLSEDEKQCRLYGLPLHLAGLVYKEFKRESHVLSELPEGWAHFAEPPVDWPVAFFIDPHPQTPHAVLFATVTPFGTRIYYHDIFKHCSIEELAEDIKAVVGPRLVIEARMDPLGFINDPITESTMADEFARHGVVVQKAIKALGAGIIRVQSELKRPLGIRFCPTARRTLWEIGRYSWDKDNKPVDKDDHMMENLYRAELSDLRFVVPDTSGPVPEETFESANLDIQLDLRL